MTGKLEFETCPDCGVKPGEFHGDHCDVERCPGCGGQFFSCGLECLPEDKKMFAWNKRLPFDGFWPGTQACIDFNLWCYWDGSKGWIKCDKDDPRAQTDLNTLYTKCRWDMENQKFVLK